MIDSQPSASRPRNPRVTARRIQPSRRDGSPRASKPDGSRWKVQLELAPAEIALVYRQGLARGAEVCRRGTHEWRPLVTTPELRAALEGRGSWPDSESGPSSSAAVTLAQSLALDDPGLARLLLAPRALSLPSFAMPPPPPVVHFELPLASARPRIDSVPDSAVTQPFPRPLPLLVPAPLRSEPPPAASYTVAAVHARPSELSFVAALSIAATLVAAVIAQRASHWGEARAKIEPADATAHAPSKLASPMPVARAVAMPISAPASSIPVVNMGALPVERPGLGLLTSAASGSSTSRSRASTNSAGGLDRASFARALAGAARAARGCGEGPVHTQIVATFGPSGVPRSVQFASAPPPAALRSCVLSAVARARVAPFTGDPVTVSKSLNW